MIRTKGNVEVDKIKIGDIHYEFAYRFFVKVEVIELPKEEEPGYWTWKSRNLKTDMGDQIWRACQLRTLRSEPVRSRVL